MVEARHQRHTRRWTAVVAFLAVAGLLVAGGVADYGVGHWLASAGNAQDGVPQVDPARLAGAGQAPAGGQPAADATTQHGTSFAKALSSAFHSAAEKVLPAVVTISTSSGPEKEKVAADDEQGNEELDNTPFGDLFRNNPDLRRFFRGMPVLPRQQVVESGSGIIIDPSGIILTNNHVVASGGKVTVRLPDGREFQAKNIKTDPKTDLAIVRIEGAGTLKAGKLGDSDLLEVGDWVLALGQPFGLEGTVTAGIISAKGRGLGITPRESFLQTDAAINPGNSGGPLVNLDGEVVGINTAISTQSGGYQGVGFAIPANLAKFVSRQLIQQGKVLRAYLGVAIQPVTPQLAEKFGVKLQQGALLADVPQGTPAEKAGLRPGDIIVEFAGKKISNPQQLQGVVEEAKIGQAQRVTVIRDQRPLTLQVVPAEQPADYGLRTASRAPVGRPPTSRFDRLGIQGESLTPERAKALGVQADHGVVVTEVRPGSLASQAGVAPGMVVTQANRKPVRSVEDLRKILEEQPLEKGILLLLQSAQGSRFVVIRAQE
jgi:serine protease Do